MKRKVHGGTSNDLASTVILLKKLKLVVMVTRYGDWEMSVKTMYRKKESERRTWAALTMTGTSPTTPGPWFAIPFWVKEGIAFPGLIFVR